MRKYYINPKFRYLGNKIKQIPIHAYQVEKTFCNHRNTVELVKAANKLFVIKRYKRPTLANCIIYTWFRKPKTRRAYENAFLLEKNGIETAEPVGYIEQYKMGFFHTGWFISRYLPYKNVRDYYDSIRDDNERAKFAHAFWQFTNTLCKKHVLSKDYNTGNILTYMKDNTYHFAMIDINRLKLGKPSTFEEAKALTQLRLKRKEVPNGLSTYAELSQHNIGGHCAAIHTQQQAQQQKTPHQAVAQTIAQEMSPDRNHVPPQAPVHPAQQVEHNPFVTDSRLSVHHENCDTRYPPRQERHIHSPVYFV